MVRDLGIVPLAEGVETSGEAQACSELGFDLVQGFFFGEPAPVDLSVNLVSRPVPEANSSSLRRHSTPYR